MANAISIVTGGTTGATDGTLVSSGNKIVFTALNTAVNAHVRVDSGQWSADQVFTLPAEVQVNFNGAGWGGTGTCPEIEDVNYPIQLRQTTLAASTSSTFTTAGTYTNISVLTPDPMTGFTATPGNTQVVLAWSAVTNRTNYTVDRNTSNASPTAPTGTAGWVNVYSSTGTTYTDTGRTNGTLYYYRIKAIGIGRYSDSTTYATASATPAAATAFLTDTFTGSGVITSHTGELGATWTAHPNFLASNMSITNNRLYQTSATDAVAYASAVPPSADYSVSIVIRRIDATGSTNRSRAALGRMSTSASTMYILDYVDDPTQSGNGSAPFLRLAKFVAGSFTQLGYYNITISQNVDYTLTLEMIGTSIKGYIDGVQRISVTDSSISAAGKAGVWMFNSASAETISTGIHIDSISASG